MVVGAGPLMRIASADAAWLTLFRFSPGEVVKKSLGICCGTKTNIAAIASMVERRAGAPTWVTLYDKSGSEVDLVVRARVQDADEDVSLEMLSVDAFSGEQSAASPLPPRGGRRVSQSADSPHPRVDSFSGGESTAPPLPCVGSFSGGESADSLLPRSHVTLEKQSVERDVEVQSSIKLV